VLADYNAVDAHVPHHGRAMPTRFELVVDLFSLVGTLNGRTAFVSKFPLLRTTSGFRKQAKIIAAMRMVRPSVFGIRATTGWRASPLAAEEPFYLLAVHNLVNMTTCELNSMWFFLSTILVGR
jgi:hypothetical protein